MKAKLMVDASCKTPLLKSLTDSIEEATGLKVSTARKGICNAYYFAIDSKAQKGLGALEQKAVNAIEAVLQTAGLNWTRLTEEPPGRSYARPLIETAAAYREHEETREKLLDMHRHGIDPMENLLAQEGIH